MTSTIAKSSQAPSFDGDLFSEQNLLAPYPAYRAIRDAGPVVWLDAIGCHAMGRYEDVRMALSDAKLFSSASGVTLNERMNGAPIASLIASDDPQHRELRKVYARPLQPKEVAKLTARIQDVAEALVDRMVAQGSIDAATELSTHLPLTIISSFVGLPDDAWDDILVWNEAVGNILGPDHPGADAGYRQRMRASMDHLAAMNEYLTREGQRDRLKPGSWGAELYAAVDRGEIPLVAVPGLLIEYIGPSIETTISATRSMIWLLTQNPDQWKLLQADPALGAGAVVETVRLETPVPWFTRVLTGDYRIGDVELAAGTRVLLLYASANRDERVYADPDKFDVQRKGAPHLGWGFGTHACAGMHLSRLEMVSILNALLAKVERIEPAGEPEHLLNSSLRMIGRLPVTLVPR